MSTNLKPLIFLGSNSAMEIFKNHCEQSGRAVHGIIDDDYYNNTESLEDIEVIGDQQYLRTNLHTLTNNFVFFLAVNWLPMQDAVSVRNRHKRHQWISLIKELSLPCINIISDTAKLSKSTVIGTNVFIGNFVVVEPRATIGDFSCVWDQSLVGHDCILGQNSTLQRGVALAGGITIGKDAYLSSFSKVLKSVTIADESQLQPGVMVFRNTAPGEIVSTDRGNLRRIRLVDQ